eukprot:TRINITY_DN7831_c0_g1_i1.p1 TRINITY_DN7831_c0_g1~~TRINITY_DN7831_c0_g1_i1.p1  ORF type:complete len:465 (-),score=65.54 TRINITY_DN7831_c0_g1_i1:33-1427(-)
MERLVLLDDDVSQSIHGSITDLQDKLRKIHGKRDVQHLKAKTLDRSQKHRNLWMLLNTVATVVCIIILLQEYSKRLAFTICALTFVQVINIFEYYLVTLEYLTSDPYRIYKKRQQRLRKAANRSSGLDLPVLKDVNSPLQRMTDASVWILIRSSRMPLWFWLEVLVTIPAPFFLFSEITLKFSTVVYLRLYIIFRVIRDYSIDYKNRNAFRKAPNARRNPPIVNTFFVVRNFLQDCPKRYLFLMLISMTLIGGHIIYAVEKESQPEIGYWIWVFVSVNCVWAGWAGDTYYEYNPTNWLAKVICILLAGSGIAVTTILFGYVYDYMRPNRSMRVMTYLFEKLDLNDRELELSARLIQVVWRFHRERRRKRTTAQQNTEYHVRLHEVLMNVRKLRRDIKRHEVKYSHDTPWEKQTRRLGLQRRKLMIDRALQNARQEIILKLSLVFDGETPRPRSSKEEHPLVELE